MILCFSGTGNSRAVAELLGQHLEEGIVRFTDQSPYKISFSGERLLIVAPIYSWGFSPLVLEFLRNLNSNFTQSVPERKAYVVATCGDECGEADVMIRRALSDVGLSMAAFMSVQMPNNYVVLPGFNVDSKEIERRKLQDFPERVELLAREISEGKDMDDFVAGPWPRLKTRMVYPLFRRWGIFPSRWYSTDACVSCGMCASVCPIGNVRLQKGRPRWGKDCVSCLACYYICPRNAVHYGKATRKKGQYFFPTKFSAK